MTGLQRVHFWWSSFLAWLQVFLWVDDPADDPNEYHTMDGDK